MRPKPLSDVYFFPPLLFQGDRSDDHLACSWPHQRSYRHDRLRLDRPGHPAAHRTPFRVRQEPLRRHRSAGEAQGTARRARHPLHSDRAHPRELPRGAHAPAHGRRRAGLLRQPLGGHLVRRHHGAVPVSRLLLHRHRERALGRLLFRQEQGPGRAHQLRAPGDDPRGAPAQSGRHHGGVLLRRQSRHGVVVRQAGAARCRRGPEACL
jgi:hypothetical protein